MRPLIFHLRTYAHTVICRTLIQLQCKFTHFKHCMKKRTFVLRKFVKSAEKIIFSFVFVCFRLTEISYLLSFPSNENVRNQHLSANAYFCVNMKFSYLIAGCKDEIFHVVLQRKQAIFCWYLGQLFVDDI